MDELAGGVVGPDDSEVRRQVVRAESLLTGLDRLPDSGVRSQALDAVHALVALYGACLERVLRHTDEGTARTLADDELVGHLLLVHDLHPDPPATRIRRALAAPGGPPGAELLAVDGATARVSVAGSGCGGSGCGTPSDALRARVEAVVAEAAPEVDRVELVTDDSAARRPALIPVETLTRRPVLEGDRR